MDSISSFAAAYSTILWLVFATAMLIVALSQRRIRFWVRDFWVTFPQIGSIARLAKDRTVGQSGWMRAEESLCAIYKPYVVPLSERTFNERIEYLRKAADLGRSPTPMWVWVLLVVLVIAEGLGFSYLLGSWMAREGSVNTHTLLMFAIVLVLCVILVAITHAAGHQYYRTSLLRSCFNRYKDVGGNEYASCQIALKDGQSRDDGEPDYKQIVNRVAKHSHDKGSYAAVVIAIVSIVFIAVVSTYMRMENLKGELSRETVLQPSPSAASNPFDKLPLPTDIVAPQQQADAKAAAETADATKNEGMAAFAMLGFIFVITQIVGMGAGYKFGFAGKESRDAHRATWGYATYDDYWAYFQPVCDLVNARLKDLQQKIEASSHTKLALSKTFNDFLTEQNAQSHEMRGKLDAPLRTQTLQPASIPTSGEPNLEEARAELSRLTDKGQQRDYFLSLPAHLQTELTPWLKQRKEEAVRKAAKARAAELDDLF